MPTICTSTAGHIACVAERINGFAKHGFALDRSEAAVPE
jgi:hypothetical protein